MSENLYKFSAWNVADDDLLRVLFVEKGCSIDLLASVFKTEVGLIEEVLKSSTCEGYDTLPQIIELAKKHNAKLPICETVYKILFENQSPNSIINVFK